MDTGKKSTEQRKYRGIDCSLIPKADMESLSRTLIADAKRMWDDPEERKKFEEWKKNRAHFCTP